ncbi:MAG: FliM/FliN family flagellar motor switch protein [Bryobacterales bacterium]|nr:FliM/FliN family flagellar motor switch protein [Bryobacterales bacterium]
MQPQIFAGASAGDWQCDLLMDLELPVSIRFGRATVSLAEALELSAGSVLELDSRVDDPVEVVVNNKVVARGNLMVVDGYYGIEIVSVPGARGASDAGRRSRDTQEPMAGNGSQASASLLFADEAAGTEGP